MPVPSGALAGASVGASALASVVDALAHGLSLDDATASSVGTSTGRIIRVLAPRVRSVKDVSEIAAELVGDVQAVARATDPADAAPALYGAAAATLGASPVSASPVLTAEYGLARALAVMVEGTCLGEAFLAEARTTFADRRAASAARGRITTAYDSAVDRIATNLGQVALEVLGEAARQCVAHLVLLSADLQPVVKVQPGRSVPSTALAWALYRDPTRAPDLVARNRVSTPLFMPSAVEAVSPGR